MDIIGLITPPEKILAELKEMDDFLSFPTGEEIESVVIRGDQTGIYMARSGKLLADAKYHLNTKMKSEVFETLKKTAAESGATSKAVNAIIDSLCSEEKFAVDWADRINRALTHHLGWCRTIISKEKAEMTFTSGRSV